MDADLFRSDGRFFNPVGCIVIGQGQEANAFFGCALLLIILPYE